MTCVGSFCRRRFSSLDRYSHRKTKFQSKPPRRSAEAPMYWKVSILMTSMMGHTTRVLSCNDEAKKVQWIYSLVSSVGLLQHSCDTLLMAKNDFPKGHNASPQPHAPAWAPASVGYTRSGSRGRWARGRWQHRTPAHETASALQNTGLHRLAWVKQKCAGLKIKSADGICCGV